MNAANQNAKTNKPETEIDGSTAEQLLVLPADYKGCPTNAIHAAIARANAVLYLLQVQVEADGDIERLSGDVLSTAIWSVQGELGLIGKMIENA